MSKDLKIDLIFNYASLGILAAAGLVMNLVVLELSGEAALGVFNQAFAIYIACSQLAVGGVHVSVLRSVAQSPQGSVERAHVIASGLLLALVLSSAVCVLLLGTRDFWSWALDSEAVGASLSYVAPALIFFSLSKTLLAAFNGLTQMRLYAVLQALRFILLIAALTWLAYSGRPASELAASLLLSEVCVVLVAAVCLLRQMRLSLSALRAQWLRHHLSFGARGLLSGVFIELNTRIDVLLIGVFASDADAGRYTIAAVFAEGLYQCLVVVKNQMNPVLARMLLDNDSRRIVELARRAWRYLYPGMGAVYLLGLGVLYVLAGRYLGVSDPAETVTCYAILGIGVVAVSGFVPFDGVLMQSGKPEYHTLFTFLIAATNAALNVAFIPLWGVPGAAAATALTLVLSIFYLNAIMLWQLEFNYLTPR